MLHELAAATGKRMVFYCAFGERSAMAVQAAQDAGLTCPPHRGRYRRLEKGRRAARAITAYVARTAKAASVDLAASTFWDLLRVRQYAPPITHDDLELRPLYPRSPSSSATVPPARDRLDRNVGLKTLPLAALVAVPSVISRAPNSSGSRSLFFSLSLSLSLSSLSSLSLYSLSPSLSPSLLRACSPLMMRPQHVRQDVEATLLRVVQALIQRHPGVGDLFECSAGFRHAVRALREPIERRGRGLIRLAARLAGLHALNVQFRHVA